MFFISINFYTNKTKSYLRKVILYYLLVYIFTNVVKVAYSIRRFFFIICYVLDYLQIFLNFLFFH